MSMFETIWKLVGLSTWWCVGIYMNSEEGDAFYFLRRWTENKSAVIFKPVVGCINCMASLHTAIIMALYFWLTGIRELWWQYIVLWLVAAIITSGLNGIVYQLYLLLKNYADYLDAYLEQKDEQQNS